MATILLSAAGLAAGGAIGGSVLGLSTAVIGRAVGAAVGRSIDARLLGRGSAPVESGRIDRFRLPASGEGRPMARVWGAARVGGQVIWASPFRESVTVTGGGGKGASRRPQVREYAYEVSLAIALCAGEITHVGRIWADGVEIARDTLALTVHRGTADQMPDPLLEAALGAGNVPAYRGTAYVVIESLDLGRFGNRVPHLSFELFRPALKRDDATAEDIARLVRGVALVPGSGDYALAVTPVFRSGGFAESEPLNIHTVQGRSNLSVSLDALQGELPECGSVSLVVSWFGDDLRAGQCTVRPRAEFATGAEPQAQVWRVSGSITTAMMTPPFMSEKVAFLTSNWTVFTGRSGESSHDLTWIGMARPVALSITTRSIPWSSDKGSNGDKRPPDWAIKAVATWSSAILPLWVDVRFWSLFNIIS